MKLLILSKEIEKINTERGICLFMGCVRFGYKASNTPCGYNLNFLTPVNALQFKKVKSVRWGKHETKYKQKQG